MSNRTLVVSLMLLAITLLCYWTLAQRTTSHLGSAPTCTPGDRYRQGYVCSPAAGAGILPSDCIQVWKAYPSPMHLETVCRGPR